MTKSKRNKANTQSLVYNKMQEGNVINALSNNLMSIALTSRQFNSQEQRKSRKGLK